MGTFDVQKERNALQTKYNEEMRKNEQDMSDLDKQRRDLEEKRNALFAAKKEAASYFNMIHNDFRGREAVEDTRELEELNAKFQHESRRAEQDFEQEHLDIERNRKKLQYQRDENERNYRRALNDVKEERK